ncbi:MAG: cadmium-translocating P-type ATPase [Lachnospiraceae bacterium]|nr:cadmium-translocating P-type ATPase [Lachnospiraceae bacterium]
MEKEQKILLVRIAVTAALLVVLHFVFAVSSPGDEGAGILSARGLAKIICYFVTYLIIGYDVLLEAAEGLKEGEPLDECFLMVVATLGAFVLGAIQSGEYTEAVAVMLFFKTGEFFEDYAVDKSKDNITALMDIRPDYANIETGGEIRKVSPEEVPVSSVIVVNPGEKIPIDGVVIQGDSSIDTRALTGESIPRDVNEGDSVVSGCVNMSGVLRVRTTKEFGESAVSRILELVENSETSRSAPERFITRFARFYTPAVVGLAVALGALPPVIRFFMGLEPDVTTWIYRALTFLVVSCPCALVISIPLTFFAGIGGAGRNGILVKGSEYVERLSDFQNIFFDKTGTLTKGVFSVQGIYESELDDETFLMYASHIECASSHPISRSLTEAYGKEVRRERVSEIKEISGKGVKGLVDGVTVAAGNEKLMELEGVTAAESKAPGTVVHLAVGGKYAGYALISDSVKESSPGAVKELEKLGVRRLIILSGDSKDAVADIANKTGISEYRSSLLPEDKVSEVSKVRDEGTGWVAFVGDGVNDAPVLTVSDIGIAMGGMGSDAAIEAADVVIMDDDMMKLPLAVRIARKCMTIAKENIIFSIGVKVLCLLLCALGLAGMWVAVFADVGVMVIAVLNAVRALRTPALN